MGSSHSQSRSVYNLLTYKTQSNYIIIQQIKKISSFFGYLPSF
jgi:hypothetical protein